MSTRRKTSLSLLLIVAFISGIFFTTVGANLLNLGSLTGGTAEARVAEVDPQITGPASEIEAVYTAVAEAINPTVVQIMVDKVETARTQENPFEGTPFEDFFGPRGPQNGRPQEYHAQGMGSGVLIRSDGLIVTNNHVVEGADELKVRMFDGSIHDAKVIGTDPTSDLAVIQIDVDNLPFIAMGNSAEIKAGQWVLAFGSPLSEQLSNTVTSGIISAVGRLTNFSENGSVQDYIQTDAAINPGNSGGPLVDLKGHLIGINTAIYSRTGGYQGIGFAIPVNTVKNVTDQLIAEGKVEHARLGVQYGPATESLIQALKLPRGAATVGSVVEGSAADKAGIKAGDVIVGIDDVELTNSLQISQIIGMKKPGDPVVLKLNRDGQIREVRVKLGAASNDETTASAESSSEPSVAPSDDTVELGSLGFTVGNLTPRLARSLGIEGSGQGVVVTDVNESSDAFRDAGVRPGLLILEINRQKVNTVAEFNKAYQAVKAGSTFLLRLKTPGQENVVVTALTKPTN